MIITQEDEEPMAQSRQEHLERARACGTGPANNPFPYDGGLMTGGRIGWVCPKCGMVMSPSVPTCIQDHRRDGNANL